MFHLVVQFLTSAAYNLEMQ